MIEGPHLDADTAIEVVHGLLDPAAEARALEHARACPDCDRHLRDAAGDRERFRARQAAVLGARPARRPWRYLLAGAAAVVAIAASLLVLRPPAPARTPSSLLGLPASSEVIRLRAPGEDRDLARLERALALYDRGEHADVAAELERPFGAPRLESLRLLYRASSLLELERTDEANAMLVALNRTNLPGPYSTWREWARLRVAGDPAAIARGDSMLRALAARPGPLQEQARRALEARSLSSGHGGS